MSISSKLKDLSASISIIGQRSPSPYDFRFESFYIEGPKVLGRGQFGVVKNCFSLKNNKEYAVKIMRSFCEEDKLMFRKEYEILRSLNSPYIVKAYDFYEDGMFSKMVVEIVKGKDMFETIVEMQKYSERKAANIFRQILKAIQYLHENQIAHRDLKPHNILVDPEGRTKVTDFNVSKAVDIIKKKEVRNSSPHEMSEASVDQHVFQDISENPEFKELKIESYFPLDEETQRACESLFDR